MSAMTLRNHRGEEVKVAEFTATEAKNSFGRVLDTAFRQGIVTISKRDHPAAVLMSMDAYQALVDAKVPPLDALTHEFDALLSRMQTAQASRAMDAAFNASPPTLGQAALAAASNKRP